MHPRSSCFPCFAAFMVTKTPQFSKSFFGVLVGGLMIFPVSKYSFTAFLAKPIRNFPSSSFSWNDKPFFSECTAVGRVVSFFL